MKNQPQAILFDLDNTLTDRRASVTVFARLFYSDYGANHQISTVDELIPIIHNADGGGYRPLDDRWRLLQKAIPWSTVPSSEELRDYWYSTLGDCGLAVDGMRTVLERLKEQGLLLGIITNGPTILQNATIDALGIRHYMDCIVVSESVGLRKPDYEIFNLALSELNLQAMEAWFVGDHPVADMVGASRAGMTTVWQRGFHNWAVDDYQPDFVIDALRELPNLL